MKELSRTILRRLGVEPRLRGSMSENTCPDIFELLDGDFAVMGTDLTELLEPRLPTGSARAEYERIVVIPRQTLLLARRDIPAA